MYGIIALFDLHHHLTLLAMAYVRIAPVFFMLPFFNDRVLSGPLIKNLLIFLILLGMWPLILPINSDLKAEGNFLAIISGELLTGLVLTLVICLPFWVASAIGELIDNQRGATISDSIDPANGVESSVLGALMNFFYSVVFLTQGGMLTLLEAFASSYQHIPFGFFMADFNWQHLGHWLNTLVLKSLTLSAPVLVVMFLCEIALGVYSRFCPQLSWSLFWAATINGLLYCQPGW